LGRKLNRAAVQGEFTYQVSGFTRAALFRVNIFISMEANVVERARLSNIGYLILKLSFNIFFNLLHFFNFVIFVFELIFRNLTPSTENVMTFIFSNYY